MKKKQSERSPRTTYNYLLLNVFIIDLFVVCQTEITTHHRRRGSGYLYTLEKKFKQLLSQRVRKVQLGLCELLMINFGALFPVSAKFQSHFRFHS